MSKKLFTEEDIEMIGLRRYEQFTARWLKSYNQDGIVGLRDTRTAPKNQFVDVIQTGLIGANTTAAVSFSTVIPAVSSTPYVIGVYPI